MKKQSLINLYKSPNTVFTPRDLAVLWGISNYDYLKVKISHYLKRKYLFRVHRGIYVKEKDNFDTFELGNKLRTPSYVSLETVLRKHGLIFQFYSAIFLISYFSKSIKVGKQEFVYKKIKDSVLFNEKELLNKGHYLIASRERAFLDAVYLYKDYYFDNLRTLNWEKVFDLMKIYESKSLEKRVLTYYQNAKSGQT